MPAEIHKINPSADIKFQSRARNENVSNVSVFLSVNEFLYSRKIYACAMSISEIYEFEISRRAQQRCSNRVALPTGRLLEGDVFLRGCGWPESWLYSGLQSRHQSFCSTKMCGIVISENVRHNPTGTTQRNQQRCHSLVQETEESFSDKSYWRDERISEGNAPPPGIST